MKIRIGVCALILSSLTMADEACFNEIDSEQFGAKFTTRNSSQLEEITQWSYWRMNNQVAYEYSQGVSDVWTKEKSGKLNLLRVFNEYGKGVSYTATDLRLLGRNENWNGVTSIIQIPSDIEKVGTSIYHCQPVSLYEFNIGEGVLSLHWMDRLNIPAIVVFETNQFKNEITLNSLITTAESKAYFQVVQDYVITDYADIGDNESDPFLSKMINLGFIEPSGSLSNDKHQHNH